MYRLPINGKHVTQILVGLLALGVWVLAIEHYPASVRKAVAATPSKVVKTLGTLDLHRVNVKDADGTTRFVISNANRFPGAKMRGKTYKRSISDAAGMVFYNANGKETGGIGTSTTHNRRQADLIFDYVYQPTDGVAMGTTESSNGKHWFGGFTVSDRRPYHPGPIKSSQGVERISLADSNHDAELVINDEQGRPRIRIGVGKDGVPHIQMLNAAGEVVYDAGPMSHATRK